MADDYESPAGLAAVHMSVEDILSFMNDFPALLWRIEIAKSRIEFLNNNYVISQGVDGKLLLKNIRYRNDVVLPEDVYLLDAFMDSVKKGKTAAMIFRVRCPEGKMTWIKITGATNTWDPRYYYGFLLNVTDTVEQIKAIMDKDVSIQSLVDETETAAVVLDYDSRKVLCCNVAACDLFEMNMSELLDQNLSDLCRESVKAAVEQMLEQVMLQRKWNGRLDFYQSGKRSYFTAETIVRHMSCGGRRLLRVKFANPKLGRERIRPRHVISDDSRRLRLVRDLAEVHSDIDGILKVAFGSGLVSEKIDAIIFSDVHVRRNQVFVYYAGNRPAELQQGQKFAYVGTIAEDISRFRLSHLTVDDTEESIKPIDWALFLPLGIRSYFAKPFFSRGVLRTVLIMCSHKPHAFTGAATRDFDDIFEPINDAVRMWRQCRKV
ncbi:PAS domain-containing protein [Desulfomicrobium salsuginis]